MATVVEAWAGLDEPFPTTEPIEPPLKPVPPPTKLTFEQANQVAKGRSFELVNGKVIFKFGDNLHSDAQALLCGAIGAYFKTNPIGRVRLEFTLCLWPENPYEARTPDLSVILNESLKQEKYGSRAPDLTIEIVSEDDLWNDLFAKAELYLEKGSRAVWIVDPCQKGVMVVTRDDRRWVKDTLTCPELLPGFSVNVQAIFTWPSTPVKPAA